MKTRISEPRELLSHVEYVFKRNRVEVAVCGVLLATRETIPRTFQNHVGDYMQPVASPRKRWRRRMQMFAYRAALERITSTALSLVPTCSGVLRRCVPPVL